MATIVSTRINRLQAVSPRTGTVTVGLGTVVDYSSITNTPTLGALASKSKVDLVNDVVGQLAAGNVTGLGALALLNKINLGTDTTGTINGATQVTNLGALAYANSIAANQIGVGTLAAGVVYAGEINANNITSGTYSGGSINLGSGTFTVGTNGICYARNMTGDFASFYNNTNGIQAAVYAFSTGTGPGLRCGNSNPEGLALRIEGHCTSTGNISISGKYYGDGSALSGITASNATYATSAGSASTASSATTASYANAVGAWPYYAAMAGSDNFAAFNSGTAFWSAKYGYGSDIALKENVVSTEKACLPLVNQIRVVDFDWKDKGFGDGRVTGVVAQELELITPELVNELTGVKMVNYTMLTPYLVKAVQELSAKVAALEAE